MYDKLLVVRLIQDGRIQHVASRRLDKVYLQMISILEIHSGKAEIVRIGKCIVREIGAYSSQALKVTRATRNDVHGRLGIVHAVGVRRAVEDRHEALRVVYMAKDGQVDSVSI